MAMNPLGGKMLKGFTQDLLFAQAMPAVAASLGLGAYPHSSIE
jgi:hypothetical protein